MNKKIIFLTLTFAILLCGCKEKMYEKSVVFPSDATIEEKLKLTSHVVPTPQQLAWQRLETTAFIHFGINTFTGREWGDGTENPALFNPENLNTDQWCECLKNADFKLVIITAKHHDGFCLWQTATTQHSVAASPWRDGKGDVVRDLQLSCEKYGLKFGVYLSPWDRNAACYGDSPAYNEFFKAQLRELLTNYGTVDEVWFDGACGEGPNGKKQIYDFASYYQLINELQPNAVVAVSGNDVRWCGNESGLGRDTEWSVTPLQNAALPEAKAENERLQISCTAKDLGSRALIEKANSVHWWPSEVDVSIRPGWFYSPNDDYRVKTVEQLTDIYFNSVGKNAVLLLNIPPNTQGLIAKTDSTNLHQFGDFLNKMYAKNFVTNAKTYWHGNVGVGERIYSTNDDNAFNVIELAEDISKGQRVEEFSVFAFIDGEWQPLTQGTTIGYKRLLRLPAVKTDKLKLVINASRGTFYIDHVKAYRSDEFVTAPTIRRGGNGTISISGNPNASIHFTTDGSTPTAASERYTEPLSYNEKMTVKAIAIFDGGAQQSDVAERTFELPKTAWQIVATSDEVSGYAAAQAIDDNEQTFWHTAWSEQAKPMPHFISVDCNQIVEAKGFTFYPRNDGAKGGIPFKYAFYISNDGKIWKKIISEKEFSNIKNNPQPQVVLFDRTYKFRYFKFVALEEVDGNSWTSVAEIDILTE